MVVNVEYDHNPGDDDIISYQCHNGQDKNTRQTEYSILSYHIEEGPIA